MGGWMGIWPMPSKEDLVPGIYVRPDLLIAQLRTLGHENFRVVLDEWVKKGWVQVSGRKTMKGSPAIFSRKAVKLDHVSLWAIELRPPIEGDETLAAYENLAMQVAESVQ